MRQDLQDVIGIMGTLKTTMEDLEASLLQGKDKELSVIQRSVCHTEQFISK